MTSGFGLTRMKPPVRFGPGASFCAAVSPLLGARDWRRNVAGEGAQYQNCLPGPQAQILSSLILLLFPVLPPPWPGMSFRQTKPLPFRSTFSARAFSALARSEILTSWNGLPVQRPVSCGCPPPRLALATPGSPMAATTATAANFAPKVFMGLHLLFRPGGLASGLNC